MKIDCTITELIQRDFNTLWKCQQLGDTLEISTPYLLPDSTLFSVLIKTVGDRCIVCDGGAVWDTINGYSSLPHDEVTPALQEMARKFKIKEGELNGNPLFFNECDNLKLASSLVFDLANFAVSATSALVSTDTADVGTEVEHRFETKAEEYVKATTPNYIRVQPRNEIIEVPGVKFGAVLRDGAYIWLVSYVNGSTLTIFRQRLSDTIINFQHAKESTQQDRIRGTIPIINNEAAGYQPSKLALHLADLRQTSEDKVVEWTHKERFRDVLLTPS